MNLPLQRVPAAGALVRAATFDASFAAGSVACATVARGFASAVGDTFACPEHLTQRQMAAQSGVGGAALAALPALALASMPPRVFADPSSLGAQLAGVGLLSGVLVSGLSAAVGAKLRGGDMDEVADAFNCVTLGGAEVAFALIVATLAATAIGLVLGPFYHNRGAVLEAWAGRVVGGEAAPATPRELHEQK